MCLNIRDHRGGNGFGNCFDRGGGNGRVQSGAVASHNGVDLRHNVTGFNLSFRIVGFKVVDHLTQCIGGGQNDIHNFRCDHHAAFAQFVKNIFGLVRKLIDTV